MINEFSNPSKEIREEAYKLRKSFNDVGKKINTIGNVFHSAGNTMTKGITAPVLAIGAASMKAFGEVDTALDTITQKTGATGEAMQGFQEVFERVSAKIPSDMDQVGAAVGEINTRLGLTGSALEDATEKFLKFSQLNGTDVESSIRTITRAMGDAGIAAEDYASILDQVNVAGQVSGVSVDKLAENLAKYGAPMRALGIDTKNSIAMFAGWEKAGVNTEIAFSGMKKAISNWGKEGKDASKEFSKTMDQIKNASGIAEATSMAIEVFGAKAGPDLADAIQNGRFEVNEYIKALEGASGSVENTFAGTEDGIDKLKTAGNSLKIALADIGGQLSGAVAPILDQVTKKIKDASKWWRSLDEQTQQNIIKFTAFAAVTGPVVLGIGKMILTVGNAVKTIGNLAAAVKKAGGILNVLKAPFTGMKKMFGSVGTMVKGAGKAFMALPMPVKVAVGVLGALIAVGTLVYKNFDKIKSFAAKMGNKVQEVAKKCGIDFGAMHENFQIVSDKIGILIGKLGDAFGSILAKMQPLIDFLKGAFQDAVSNVFEFVSNYIAEKINNIRTMFDGFMDVLDGIILFLDGDFQGGFQRVFTGIGKIVQGAMSNLVSVIRTPLNAVISLVNRAIEGINSIHLNIPEGIPFVGGTNLGFNLPKIPMLAKGTDNWKGGPAVINEAGGEIVDLPRGTRVYPHDESIQRARQEGERKIAITIAKLADQIIVREDADIDRIAKELARELKEVASNMV